MKTAYTLLIALLLLVGCSAPAEKPAHIINIMDIVEKPSAVVAQVLGEPASMEAHKGYPCEFTQCTKAFYQDGKYEIIFKRDTAYRITIYDVPDLTSNKLAITSLGLPASEPDAYNPNNTVRWEYAEGIDEISFFNDYILVDANKLW